MTAAAETLQGPVVGDILGRRRDYAIISGLIEPGTKVLDLGCGDGELLAWLARHKQVDARGVELDAGLVRQCIARGLSVYQSDIEQGLADYPDQAFDYIILSQTLQQMRQPLTLLLEMLRVGRQAIVAFPNFGHWRVRVSHLASGRAPRTPLFPYNWYDSPNLHFLTVLDFEELCRDQRWHVEQRVFLSGQSRVRFAPNLLAETAVFQVRRP